MRTDDVVECHPPPPPAWHWVLALWCGMAISGALILAPLVMVSELMTGYRTPAQVKGLFAVVSGALGIVVTLWFIRWEQGRWYWLLTPDELIGGKNRDTHFPLSSVTAVVPGLPDRTDPVFAVNRFLNLELWRAAVIARQDALLLKFTDGSMMPFHVHGCVGGPALMDGLVARLEDRLRRDYAYAPEEIAALRRADWNRIARRRGR